MWLVSAAGHPPQPAGGTLRVDDLDVGRCPDLEGDVDDVDDFAGLLRRECRRGPCPLGPDDGILRRADVRIRLADQTLECDLTFLQQHAALGALLLALGLALLYRPRLRRIGRLGTARQASPLPSVRGERAPLLVRRVALACLLLFCLTIPSNWTQDIPARYGKRHAGLRHSWLYPQIDAAAPSQRK